MNQDIVVNYLNELPRELVKAVNPLSNNKELALYVCILKEGPFRFNELREKFKAHQQELSSALNSLMIAGLVERKTEISEDSFAEINYYSASTLGESMMRSMIKGALFIDSDPDCLRRFGRCSQVGNYQPTFKSVNSDNQNPLNQRGTAIIIGCSSTDLPKKFRTCDKSGFRREYEPDKATG
jgi:DNA-binding HxlR family transcriptional regulator